MREVKILVSACLVGINCRYNAKPCPNSKLLPLLRKTGIVLICPELLANQPIPRPACNLCGGDGYDVLAGKAKVIGVDGKDYTKSYVEGAKKALEIAIKQNITHAYLKSGSPTCGYRKIHSSDGRKLINGNGIFTALLIENNILITAF